MEDKRSFTAPIVSALLLLLLCLYVGAYYAMVDRVLRLSYVGLGGSSNLEWEPRYSIGESSYDHRWTSTFFHPVHLLDRRLRRSYWEEFLAPDSGKFIALP